MPSREIKQSADRTRKKLLLSTALIVGSGVYACWQDPADAAQNGGHYNDGEFIGKTADTIWGEVQVKALVHNGSITDVQFLQYPSHRRRSALISGWAMPMLRSEAIRAQSADVDIVSQASITAEGFQESLASALKQATK